MKDEYLQLLVELMGCASVSADIAAVNKASSLVAEFARAKGLFVKEEMIDGRKTIYAATHVEEKRPDVLFNAHLDVVPPSVEGQHVAYEENGILHGRGCADDLGNAVCMLKILCQCKDKSVGAIFSTDEEIGGNTTLEMAKRGYCGRKGIVILDTAGDSPSIYYAEKGILGVKLTAYGKTGHSAYPWTGDNALEKLILGYAKLRTAWQNPQQEENWIDSLEAVGMDAPCIAHNIIPEKASMLLDIRYTEPNGEEAVLRRIRETTELNDVEVFSRAMPVFASKENPFLQAVRSASKSVRGHEVPIRTMNGATDARHFAEVFPDIPIVMDGVRGGNFHGPGEWLDIASIDATASVYLAVLREL